jgi:hypothetical protein
MSIKSSKHYQRTWRSVRLRIGEAWNRRDFKELESILESPDMKVVNEVHAIATALENVRISARELRQLASAAFRCPKGLSYEKLIRYHNVAALHEVGACRNRVIRLLNHFTKQARKCGGPQREGALKILKVGFLKSFGYIQGLRDKHDHVTPFTPPRLSAVRYIQTKTAARKVEYRRIAEQFADGWEGLARLVESHAELELELAALLLIPTLTNQQFAKEFVAINRRSSLAVERVMRDLPNRRQTQTTP